MMKRVFAAACGAATALLLSPGAASTAEPKAKPALSLRASPQVALTPARVVVTGDLRNVTDDDEQLYCPEVEWDWGDGTQSASTANCAPYEPGTSKVKIRYVQQHTYNYAGRYQVTLRLRKGSRTLLSGSTSLSVRGAYD